MPVSPKERNVPSTFAEQPIPNYPYAYPRQRWEIETGLPTDRIVERRRQCAP